MLTGRVAVVTGGASGIGSACCRMFTKNAAKVVVADIQRELGESLVKELGADSAIFVPCDVTQESDIAGAVQAAMDKFGKLDIMVNNAGIGGKQGRDALMENLDASDFDHVLQVNLRSVVLGTKYAAQAMKESKVKGCIINTASIAGFAINLAPSGPPVYVPSGYAASKHAMIGVTKVAACELAPYGIRVNAVAPGITATPLVAPFLTGRPDASQEEVENVLAQTSVLKGIPLVPDDIANAMLYLASDMGRNVNAHTLVIDQGVTAGVSGVVPALAPA